MIVAITIAKEQYPEFAGAAGTSGKRFMLYLNYGEGATAESPKWVKLGGSESLQFTPTVDVQTKQTKDSGMWAEGAVTGKSFEVSDTVLMKRGDTAQKAIEAFIYDDEITAERRPCSLPALTSTQKNIECLLAFLPLGQKNLHLMAWLNTTLRLPERGNRLIRRAL